jgi:hypothetical protein
MLVTQVFFYYKVALFPPFGNAINGLNHKVNSLGNFLWKKIVLFCFFRYCGPA